MANNVLTMIANLRQELAGQFTKLCDGKKEASINDVAIALNTTVDNEQLLTVFKAADANTSDGLDLDEFTRLCLAFSMMNEEEEGMFEVGLFVIADSDNSGKVSTKEILRIMEVFGAPEEEKADMKTKMIANGGDVPLKTFIQLMSDK